jgi:hypothetical protein
MFSRDPTGSALAAQGLNPPESLSAATPAVIPTFPHVLAAPLVAIFSPVAAARTLVAAPPAAFWATFVMLCLAHALAYTFVLLSIEMFQTDGVVRSPLFAWRDLNGGNRLGPVEAVFAAGLVVVPAWVALTSCMPRPCAVRGSFKWYARTSSPSLCCFSARF